MRMPDSRTHSQPRLLSRRTLLGQSVGVLAGLVLVGCGGPVPEASEQAIDDEPGDRVAGLGGVRIEVWRDPG